MVFLILLLPSINKGPRSLTVTVSSSIPSSPSTQYKQLDSSFSSCSIDTSKSSSSSSESSLACSPHTSLSLQKYQNVAMESPTDSKSKDVTVTLELGVFSSPSSPSLSFQQDSSSESSEDSSRRHLIDTLHSAFTYSDNDDDDDDVEVELFCNDDFNSSGSGSDSDTGVDYNSPCFVSYYGRHLALCESLRTWRIYAIMVIFCTVAGSGILVINNIQAVAGAVDKQPSSFFVTIISLANAGGRVLIGLVADASSEVLSRFQLLALISLLMAVTQFLLSFGSPLLLYPCLLMTGAMFGATFSNTAAITSDVFGSMYVGSNYGFIDLAPAIGSYVFSAGLVALYYPENNNTAQDDINDNDNDNDNDNNSNVDHFCKGAYCFRGAFIVTSCACLFTALLSYFLHLTTPMRKKL